MIGDTILALATAPGGSERAVLRLSGPAARAIAGLVFAPPLPTVRAQVDGMVAVGEQQLPAFALHMPGPGSYTGEDCVELHVPGSPLLCRLLLDAMLTEGQALGARAAVPGEFTARAFLAGKLDLTQAEGVLLLIHGADLASVQQGLQWLRGGLSAAVAVARSLLQDALAWIESGLDFTAGETGEVPDRLWLPPLQDAVLRLEQLLAAIPVAAPGGEVLLLGAANAGKSALCNALAGRDAVLVADIAGTTRDLLRVEIAPGVVLWDAPGDLVAGTAVDREALALRDRLAGQAAAGLWVVDPRAVHWPTSSLPALGVVFTKLDLGAPDPDLVAAARARLPAGAPVFCTSARTGAGLEELTTFLRNRAAAGAREVGGPLREAVGLSLEAARRAAGAAAAGAGTELIAADLQQALVALDRIDGRHSPEHLLDRIFGRFCLGK